MHYICPRLFTVCWNPIAWKISNTEGYRLSKPISFKVTDLLYIDDLKIFAASESKLNWVMNMAKTTMKDVCSGSCEKRSVCEWQLEEDIGRDGQDTKLRGREAVQVPRRALECYAGG